jgi:hypothetical protein
MKYILQKALEGVSIAPKVLTESITPNRFSYVIHFKGMTVGQVSSSRPLNI